MRAAFGSFGVAFVSLTFGCQAFVGDYATDLSESEAVDVQPLCEIERARFVLAIDFESDEHLEDLVAYYERDNPDFVEHIRQLVEDFEGGATRSSVTYLSGAAGVGKSFVLRGLDDFGEERGCEVVLTAAFGSQAPFEVVQRTDLKTLDDTVQFNELPAIADLKEFDLLTLFEDGGCFVDGDIVPSIVVDGVDEIHDDSSHAVLEAIDQFIMDQNANDEPFVHVLVAGRPEGFQSWLTDPFRTERSNDILARYDLEPPHYQTGGDLEFRALGYWDFSKTLPDLEADGLVDDYLASFRAAMQEHPFLSYSIGNLALGNVAVDHTAPDLEQDEQTLKAGLFDDMLVRNSETHGRPGASSPYEGPYRRALEDVAARYADVNDEGVFVVRSEDTVEVTDDAGSRLGEVRVRDLLARAGVAFLTSASSSTTRYRFDPFWLHAHLIERRNRRLVAGYGYRGCE